MGEDDQRRAVYYLTSRILVGYNNNQVELSTCAPASLVGTVLNATIFQRISMHTAMTGHRHGERRIIGMSTITFSAARRRFERAHDNHRTISKMSQTERQGMGGSPFALVEGSTIMDVGDLTAVERWCRDAGVLGTGETVAG